MMKKILLLKSTTLVSALSLSCAAFAQVDQVEFEALLNQNNTPSVTNGSEGIGDTIEVLELDPSLIYEEIDSNRAQVDTLKSQIRLLEAKKEMLTLSQEVDLLESGQAQLSLGFGSRDTRPNVIDSTDRFSPQNVDETNTFDDKIDSLQASITSLEENMSTRVNQVQEALEQTRREKVPTTNVRSFDDELRWSVVSTTTKDSVKYAEIVNDYGRTFHVKNGDSMGSLTVLDIGHGNVQVRGSNGKTLSLGPRNLTYFQPLPDHQQGAYLESQVTTAEYPSYNDSTRME